MLAPFSWVRPSDDLRSSSSYCFGALAAIQALASARNAASCGVSSKFMDVVPSRVLSNVLSVVGRQSQSPADDPQFFSVFRIRLFDLARRGEIEAEGRN